jgi:hypothetical protein
LASSEIWFCVLNCLYGSAFSEITTVRIVLLYCTCNCLVRMFYP